MKQDTFYSPYHQSSIHTDPSRRHINIKESSRVMCHPCPRFGSTGEREEGQTVYNPMAVPGIRVSSLSEWRLCPAMRGGMAGVLPEPRAADGTRGDRMPKGDRSGGVPV
jgi:hypothetical protein